MFTGPWVPRSLQLRQVDEVTLRITHIPLCPPLSRLHAYSGSTRDVSQILVNKAGSATHPQGSSGPGCSLFTSWAVGPCLWVHCGIKKLSPTFHLYSRAFWDFSQRALKEFDMQVPPHPMTCRSPHAQRQLGQKTNLSNRYRGWLRITLLPQGPRFHCWVQLVLASCFFPGRIISYQPPQPSCKHTHGWQVPMVARPVSPGFGLNTVPPFQKELDFLYLKVASRGNVAELQSRCKKFSSRCKVFIMSLAHAYLVIISCKLN